MKKKDNEELIKKKIAEKDNAKIEYDQKIGDIKVTRGVNFSVDYLKNENINTIVFTNLKYKNEAKNVSVFYNGERKLFNAITYEPMNNGKEIGNDEKGLFEKIKKEYKLKQVVDEIEKANNKYQNDLIEIDKKYQELEQVNDLSDDEVEIKKTIKNA